MEDAHQHPEPFDQNAIAIQMADVGKMQASLEIALRAIDRAAQEGKENLLAWDKLYKGLVQAKEISPELAAGMELSVISHFKPDSPQYGTLLTLFEQNIEALKHNEKTDQALSELARAVIGDELSGPALKASNSANPQKPEEAVPDPSSEQASPSFPKSQTAESSAGGFMEELSQKLQEIGNAAREKMSEDANLAQEIAEEKKHPPASNPVTYEMPQSLKDSLAAEYWTLLDVRAQKSAASAASSLIDVLTSSSVKNLTLQEDLWGAFNKYLGQLSGKASADNQTDIAAANADIREVWDSLPSIDAPHRELLLSMARNYALDDLAAIAKPQEQPFGPALGIHPTNADAGADPSKLKRNFDVNDTDSISPSLPVPAQPDAVKNLRL